MADSSNFEEILNRWEQSRPDSLPPEAEGETALRQGASPTNPAKLRVDMTLDLHGLTVAEAELQTGSFLAAARREGARKVLIIHGKGNHSSDGAVLGKWLRAWLEKQKGLGARGQGSASEGGSGATWVVLKY